MAMDPDAAPYPPPILSRKLPNAVLQPPSSYRAFGVAWFRVRSRVRVFRPLEVNRLARLRSPFYVSVFVLRRKEHTPTRLSIHYRHVESFFMAARGESGKRELMAASAWVTCEGVRRRTFLTKLGAPDGIVRHQTDVRAIASEIQRGPSEFPEDAYVYDNMVESWLILIADDDTKVCSRILGSVRDVPRSDRIDWRGRGGASHRPRWFPENN